MNEKNEKNRSKTAYVISDILACFNYSTEEIGINDLARKLGLYPSKIHRIVSSLEATGFLEKNPLTRKYRIGLRLFEIGILYPFHLNLRKIASPHGNALAKELETNVHLGILSTSTSHYVVIIARFINVQSDNAIIQRVSFNVPIHSSSLGKVLLAFSYHESMDLILKKMTLEKFTEATITERELFKQELRRVRNQGYAIDRGETHAKLYCIAAPIKDSHGVVAAISVSDLRERVEREQKKIIKRIITTADFISYQIGH